MSKLGNIFAAACLLITCAASAETYEGVQPLTTERERADVVQEAIAAARLPNPYAEGAMSGVMPALLVSVSRSEVERAAVAAAHAANQNIDPRAFFESTIPAQFNDSAINSRVADEASDAGVGANS